MIRLFRIALAVVIALTLVGTAGAQEKKAKAAAAGKVKAVDAEKSTVTLEGKKGKDGNVGPDITVEIAKDAKITAGGEAKKLADVKVGDVVQLTLAEPKLVATALTVGPTKGKEVKKAAGAAGAVKAVDAEKRTITLEGVKNKKDNTVGPDQVIALAKDARVTVAGEAKTLADLKAGDKVQVTLADDKKTATAVTVGKKKDK